MHSINNTCCRHISTVSPSATKALSALISADSFGASTAVRGRMKPEKDCFVLQATSSSSPLKTLMFPLRPAKGACNVYGSVHGGALWSFSDIASTLHLSLFLQEGNQEQQQQQNFQMMNASCRYHNGVAEDSPLVCISTIVSCSQNMAHFYVDLVPEKFTPLKFDVEADEWKIRESVVPELNQATIIQSSYLTPDSTFTRATFTKKW